MSTPDQLLSDLDNLKSRLESTTASYLSSMGWRGTCELGALWLWTREIDGKVAYVNEASALWLCAHGYCDEPQAEASAA